MQESNKYRQLQFEERMTIASMSLRGCSVRAMAHTLQRSASTVSRELRRNALADAPYTTLAAQSVSCERRSAARPAPKLQAQSVCWGLVQVMLGWKWSPQQIAGILKRAFPPPMSPTCA